jgi:hypothetical protein
VIALIRYQAGLLLRSNRWVGPVAVYAAFAWFVGDAGQQPLGDGLRWSAAALLPLVAWLTRSMITAEPGEARACVAAAGGPHRAHLAALITALAGGAILALGGAALQLGISRAPAGGVTGYATTVAAGLATAAICIGVGSAVGAVCSPPVVRGVAAGFLVTPTAIVATLVAGVSPANAVIRQSGPPPHLAAWPTGLPLAVTVALLAVCWAVSTVLAARRGT